MCLMEGFISVARGGREREIVFFYSYACMRERAVPRPALSRSRVTHTHTHTHALSLSLYLSLSRARARALSLAPSRPFLPSLVPPRSHERRTRIIYNTSPLLGQQFLDANFELDSTFTGVVSQVGARALSPPPPLTPLFDLDSSFTRVVSQAGARKMPGSWVNLL